MSQTEPPQSAPVAPLDRRALLKAGALGAGLFSAPVSAALGAKGFTHGVASGEPGARRALLWTRFVAEAETRLTWEVSKTSDFGAIVSSGEVAALPSNDFCAKAWADGLEPGHWYYYRFVSPAGTFSDIGRTRTLPEGPASRWRMAVFSCSNIGFGWFNAYALAAASNEFDCVLHLGDYFYEYPQGTYPSPGEVLAERGLLIRNRRPSRWPTTARAMPSTAAIPICAACTRSIR